MSYAKLLEQLRHVGDQVTLRKKNHIAYQGEVPRYGYYVLDGAVKAYVITGDGNQSIVDIHAKHSLLPLSWLNHTSSTAIFYYEAMTDVRAIRFGRAEFERVMTDSPSAQADYIEYLANAQMALSFRSTGLCQPNAIHKVCYALHFLVYRYGVEQSGGRYLIPVPLTHEVIGNFIGQSRENTAKTVKKLSDGAILVYESKLYTIDMPRLERFLGEDSFRELIED